MLSTFENITSFRSTVPRQYWLNIVYIKLVKTISVWRRRQKTARKAQQHNKGLRNNNSTICHILTHWHLIDRSFKPRIARTKQSNEQHLGCKKSNIFTSNNRLTQQSDEITEEQWKQLTSAKDGSSLFNSLRHDAQRIMQRSFCLVEDLLSGSSEHNRACFSQSNTYSLIQIYGSHQQQPQLQTL